MHSCVLLVLVCLWAASGQMIPGLVSNSIDAATQTTEASSSKSSSSRRTRQVILEITQNELDSMVKSEAVLAVLFQDNSKQCSKALHDLELIAGDCSVFGIVWRRVMKEVMPSDPVSVEGETPADIPQQSGCYVMLYVNEDGSKYQGNPDRQTAVFRWILMQMFCNMNAPLPIQHFQFDILTRTFRNFILLMTTPTIRSSQHLIEQFSRLKDLCSKVGQTLVVSSSGEESLRAALGLSDRGTWILNVIHGSYIAYEGSLQNMVGILQWINIDTKANIKIVGEANLNEIIQREDCVLVLFLDESTMSVNFALRTVVRDLETNFGLIIVEVNDPSVSESHGIASFPTVALFESGLPRIFRKADLRRFSDSMKAAQAVKEWVVRRLELKDRLVIRTIIPSAFKKNPDDFKQVLMKEHKDAIRKISFEYARLQRENEQLRDIIEAGQVALAAVNDLNDDAAESSEEHPRVGRGVSTECRSCLASVGMAIWNCGTFEMDCIKGAIELGSECYPCVCEVVDFWWPDDAPNCFKREIQKIITKERNHSIIPYEQQ